MDANLGVVFKFIIEQEGTSYTDTPGDPGGPTRYGVTLETWRAFNHNPALTANDIRNLTYNQALMVFAKAYWHSASVLPSGVDLAVSDMAYNAGVYKAIQLLQKAMGFRDVDCDGVLGPTTLGAANNMNKAFLINEYAKECAIHYRSLPHFQSALLARNERRLHAALALISK